MYSSAFLLTRLLRGVTLKLRCNHLAVDSFLLTRLLRGVTEGGKLCYIQLLFLLTRLLRGVTRLAKRLKIHTFNFYSHASCEA